MSFGDSFLLHLTTIMYLRVKFAVTQIVGFFILLPIMFATEGEKFGTFLEKLKTEPSLQYNLIMSGLCFYIYNELATYTLQVTGAVTASVANTAKRVVSDCICFAFLYNLYCNNVTTISQISRRLLFPFKI